MARKRLSLVGGELVTLKRRTFQSPGSCIDDQEITLAGLINQYRQEKGLPSVLITKSLTEVAQWHSHDLSENAPNTGTDHGLACNLHSWSDKGWWSKLCYTGDHQYKQNVWNKPNEITNGVYTGRGYEISAQASNAYQAFELWKASSGHNQMILEQEDFNGYHWKSMGVGIKNGYFNVWFGEETDPAGPGPEYCGFH